MNYLYFSPFSKILKEFDPLKIHEDKVNGYKIKNCITAKMTPLFDTPLLNGENLTLENTATGIFDPDNVSSFIHVANELKQKVKDIFVEERLARGQKSFK